MADNVAQQIKNLSDEIARLDKGLENTKALADKIFENSKDIGDALQKSFRKGDDAAKETTAVLKELLKTITDNFGNGKELKLAIGIEKDKLRHDIAKAEDEIRQFGEKNSLQQISDIKKYKQQLAQLADFERTFADINKVINGDNGKQQSQISKQRVKDEKDVQKIQEQTTAALQKRIELEERLKTLKPNGKAWRDTKAEIENVNKEVQNYLAKMGSFGTAGARQLKAYEKAGLITNADKTKLAIERQQIDLLRQRMQAEEQLNRLLLQRDNAALAGKTVSPKVIDSISRLQERIDTIDKKRDKSYQDYTQVSLQRIEGMWQNHETALTNIKTQGEQARQRIESRNTEQLQIAAQKQIVDILKQQLAIQNQIDKLKQAPQQTQAVQQQIQNLTQQYNQLGSSIRAIANGNQDIINQAQAQVAAQKQHQENIKNTTSALSDAKNQEKAYNDGIKQMQKDEDNARKDIISLMQQQIKIQGQLNRLQNAPSTQAVQQQIQNLTAQYQTLGYHIQVVANGNQRLIQSAQQYVSAQVQAQQNAQQTTNAINAARQQAQAQAQAAKQRAAIERKADSESIANQRRQIQIKAQLSAIDKARNSDRDISSKRAKAQIAEENAEYKRLSAELTRLIARQKELNKISQGSGSRARGRLQTYEIIAGEQALRRYEKAWRRVNREQKQSDDNMKRMLSTVSRLASAFGVAFSVQGLVQFGKKLVETRGEFELQQVALRSILQNKQLADEIWDKTMQAALQSPFTAMQLTKYTKQLAAYRIETDKLFDTTKRLADVSAGLGVDMQRLILAYGQVKAANYLRASEIRQFTEAGVNVLGELSNYFSETRGQMYSTAQVMDMVQKRMVKFEDVEEIFKRLTDEGGIFYNMQYVQSQTVWGQLRKLRDAYDQMQNSIGKANEGVIKDFVSILNSAVQNWRGIAVTLKSIGWGVAIGWMSKYALALSGISAASMKTKRSIVSLRQGIDGFGKALKANLPMLAIGAAAALITRFVESARQMKQVNDEIDEQITTLYGASQQMTDYQSTIEKNNALIKSNGKEISDNKKRQEALNDALDSNRGIYSKLKNDYPQIAEQLKQNANGTIENTDALKAYNEQLEREMTLLAMREQKANIGNLWGAFSDSATEDLQDALKNTTKVQTQIRNLQLRLKTDVAKMKASGNVDERQIEIANEFLAIPTEGDMEEALRRANEIRQKYLKEYAQYVKGDIGRGGYKNLGELSVFGNEFDIKGLEHTMDEFRREMVNIGWIGEGENLGKLETDFANTIQNFSQFAESISKEYSGDVMAFIRENSEVIKKAIEGDADNGIEASPEIVKGIGDALIKAGYATTKEMQSVWNTLLNQRIIFTEKNEELNAIDAQIAAEEAKKLRNRNQQLLTDLKKQRDDYIKSHGLDWFAGSGTTSGTNQQSPFDDNNKGKKSASKLISLIREMRAEYDKLSKSAYGYAKSEDTVRKSYEKAVETILGKAGVTKNYDFTTNEGMIAALEKVKAYATKLGPEAAAEVEKYIGQLKSEIELNVQVKVRDDFNRDLEKMFSNYELTLELQGLNIPEGMAKDLFPDLDYTTLGEIQDRMRKFYEDQRNANGEVLFDKDDLEQYRKWSDKVDAEILKSRKEKAKQYSKYLEKEYSDRAKLEMQHAKDVAFVTANVSDETQRKNIITQIDKKYQDDLNELHWKSFKESSFYVEMMDDISSLPKEYMQMMLDKIEEILQHPETLSPRALKEAINARQKVLEAQMNLEPLEVMKVSLKSIRAAMASEEVGAKTWKQTKENLNEQITLQGEKIAKYEQEINDLRTLQGELKGYEELLEELRNADKKIHIPTLNSLLGLDNEQKLSDITDLDDKGIQDAVDLLTKKLNEAKGQYDATVKTDEMNARAVEISDTEHMIALLNEELKARQKLDAYKMSAKAQSAAATGQTSTNVGAQITQKQDEKEHVEEQQTTFKDWLRSFKNFDESFAKFNAAINSTLNAVQGMGNAFYDMFDALGGSTDALTDGWKEFGNTMISTITQTLTTIPMMVAAFTAAGIAINGALGIIGLIAEALQLLFVAIGAIAKLHDAHYEREIEIQQKKIDDLKDAYARLERQIEQTFTTSSYMREFNEQIENLREQMASLEAQRSAESSKKNADADRVREYTNAIIDAQDEIDELGQHQIEVFGGIGKDNYRSWAEGFVDAWKDAFLETGDGLDALQDHFDEFLQEWFVKQATMRIAGKALEGVMGDIDRVVSDNGVVDWAELQRIKDQMDLILPDLNDKLTAFAGMWDFGGEGGLSGLAAGIQGMTEEQANILEAYWNSVRMYTASIDGNVSRIAEMLGANGPNSNPMLTQLQAIAANTNYIPQIYNLLMNTRRNNGNGQGFLTYSM